MRSGEGGLFELDLYYLFMFIYKHTCLSPPLNKMGGFRKAAANSSSRAVLISFKVLLVLYVLANLKQTSDAVHHDLSIT